MLFAIHALDVPESLDKRMALRPAHRRYLGEIEDKTAYSGPLVADDGITMVGSLMIISFPNRQKAVAWLAKEPFNKGGLFASVTLYAYKGALGSFQSD